MSFKNKTIIAGALVAALPLISIASNSTFASTPASANGMSGFIYKCTVKNYNEQTGETDTGPLFTDEQLASIKTLNCRNVDYTASDIENWSQGLNKLTGLEELDFTNVSYTFMTGTLDLSFAPNLKNLSLNQLNFSGLDISQNPELVNLRAELNQLASIDTSNNPKLEGLYIRDNKITELNVDQNPNLKYLYIGGNENLATVDLSNNTELKSLNISGTAIENINIEKNTALSDFLAYNQSITSAARVKKVNGQYEIDLSQLKFVNGADGNMVIAGKWEPEESEYYQYDSDAKTITISDLASIVEAGGITFIKPSAFPHPIFTLSLRPVDIDIIVFSNGEKLPNYSLSDDAKFVGDTWNTEDYTDIINTLYGEDLESATLASVIAKTKVSGDDNYTQIGEDFGNGESTPKLSGTLEDIERIALIYNYESDIPAVPETGYTTEHTETMQAAKIHNIIVAVISVVCMASTTIYIVNRYRNHHKLNRF